MTKREETPLDANLDHRLLRVFREGMRARDTGAEDPYRAGTLEHCLHASGWVSRDLSLALQRESGGKYTAPELLAVNPAEGAAKPIEPEAALTSNIGTYIADTAKSIVSGARRGAYGSPERNFERIARYWTAYFQNTGRDVTVAASDVSPLMRFVKEARLNENPKHLDSFVDLVGYTLTGAETNGVDIPD